MEFNRIYATCLLSALAVCACWPASAVPVFGKAFDLRQPDGSLVSVKIWGDEYYQVVESPDGYTLVRDPKSGIICYAKVSADGGQLTSTGIAMTGKKGGPAGLSRHLRVSAQARKAAVASAQARFAAGEAGTLKALGDFPRLAPPCNGDVKALCLIVDFPDARGTIAASEVDRYCNQTGYVGYGNNGSVRDYFYDVSDGHLNYTNYVSPTYYTAVNAKSYYDNPTEECGPKARELIIEALNWLDASGFDFSQYDANHDGLIDGINCLYAGACQSGWAKGLWPHSWTVSFSADGVSSYKYQITDMGSSLAIGTFCHENGHMICYWPDLYDYGYQSEGAGNYCLMASGSWGGGGYNPVEPCPYLSAVAGWTSVTTVLASQTGLSVVAGINAAYKLPHPSLSNEYYMVSNLNRSLRNASLPSSGLAIWHIDTNGSNDNEQMTPTQHYLVTVVQADGNWDLEKDRNRGDSTDLWRSPTYVQCGPSTSPNTNWWDGTSSGVRIYNISADAATMTFDVDVPLATSLADALDNSTLTWSSAGGGEWQGETVISHDGQDAAQSGGIVDSQSSILKTSVVGPGTLTFWWKVSSESSFDYLSLYCDGVLQSGQISGEVTWQQKTYELAAGNHTLEWIYSKDGSLSSGSDRGWVDQVTFTRTCPPDGDVNGDGSVTPSDALLTFQCYLGQSTLTDCQRLHADVSEPQTPPQLTPADALCIFQYYLGRESCIVVSP